MEVFFFNSLGFGEIGLEEAGTLEVPFIEKEVFMLYLISAGIRHQVRMVSQWLFVNFLGSL